MIVQLAFEFLDTLVATIRPVTSFRRISRPARAIVATPVPVAPLTLADRLAAFGVTQPIEIHHNRRVMVSMSRERGFRVHGGYAEAPDSVVAAIAKWSRPWLRKSERRAAAKVFLAFSVHGDAAPPVRRRPEPLRPGDDARLARIRELHHALNAQWFESKLSAIEIVLSGRMRRKLGHYAPRSSGAPVIALSRGHLHRDGWVSFAETLLHEMVHQWQDETGLPVDHGAAFRAKARQVGIEPRAIATRR